MIKFGRMSTFIIHLVGLAMAITNYGGSFVVVPNDLFNAEGNAGNFAPFGLLRTTNSMRYQQVYDAAQFSGLQAGEGWITRIFFRGDGTAKGSGTAFNIQINFSTTLKVIDGLSTVFSENVGVDDTSIFGPGSLFIRSSGGTPQPFDIFITPTRPFYYNRSAGNLLLDVRNFEGQPPPFIPGLVIPAFDASNTDGDGVSRVYADSVGAGTATVVDSLGLVTGFEMWPTPKLTITQTTNSFVITWPAEPQAFVFQTADSLKPSSVWQTITNGIGGDASVRSYTVPLDTGRSVQFFRLVCQTCRSR